MRRAYTTAAQRTARSGFTLLELLIVIAVIAILVSLLTVAIVGARRRVQLAAVSAEITQLDQAIASFKTRYGIEPPSSLTIPTSATGWSAEDRQKVLRIWDQFDFTTLGGFPGGYPSTAVHLNGAECLVFFLGGLNSGTPAAPALVGFSKNPRTPWNTTGANRDTPFYDGFDAARLVDVDGDSALEFLDSLPGQTVPFLFLCSQGKSYRKTNNTAAWDDYDVFGMNDSKDLGGCYLEADGKTPHRASGYQIISPGFDGAYGVGGIYKDDGKDLTAARATEADNITNFAGGVLKK